MRLSNLLHESWLSISASRLRTALAMLGIVIGVGSVVLMLAIGTGSSRTVEQAIKKLGTNLLIITSDVSGSGGVMSSNISSFKISDALILGQLPSVADAAALTERRPFQVRSAFSNYNANVQGISEAGVRINNWKITEGLAFNHDDIKTSNRVVILGKTVADELFPNQSAVGSNIQINNITFRVVGLLNSKGQSLDGRDQDNIAYVPITTAESKLWGYSYFQGVVQMLMVQAISKDRMPQATEEARQALRDRFKLRGIEADNFRITNLTAITKVASETARAISILLGAIASISLIVGGIGIMNIMLVTVSERTREIGIRKAIGANEFHILLQFLMEALMIAIVGSILGLGAGFGLGFAAEKWLGVATYYSVWSVVISLVVACGVGVASGLYPAYKAAKLQPIEALRVS